MANFVLVCSLQASCIIFSLVGFIVRSYLLFFKVDRASRQLPPVS
ncbi:MULTISPECIES: hypothetical protein [Microcoleaceae]|nr:hypothetical protein [Tychonema sp. LEGE 06208]